MAEFSPADAALEGFRLGRENPGGLALWTLLIFVFSLISDMIMIQGGTSAAVGRLGELMTQQPADPAEVSRVLQDLMPGFLKAQAPLILAQVLIQAAVLRIALRPGARRYLGLGRDELRVLGAFLLTLAVTVIATMAVTLAGALVSLAVAPLGAMIVVFGSLAAALFVTTRLQLLYPQAVADASLNLASAWLLTRGRFWRVFAAWFMAVVFFIIVLALGGVIAYTIRAVAGIDTAVEHATVSALLRPGELGATLVESLLQAMGLVLLTAPAAAIYRKVRPASAEVF